MLSLPITTLLAIGLASLLMVLSVRVIQQRRDAQVSLGDGGDADLSRRSRAHGNLTEYAPLFVILVGLSEAQLNASFIIAVTAGLFFAGRVMHAYALAFTSGNMKFRVFGMMLTFIAFGLSIAINLFAVLT